jgi:predicted PurR-regulated permease PerM
VFAIGFSAVGVPHALVAALAGGAFSLIPNGQASGWILAVLFGVLERGGEAAWVTTLLYPSIVYAISQSLEVFVITPLVQGSYARLHPLAVLAALIGGASVGGVFGILVAIPLTACAKIVLEDAIEPALRRNANQHSERRG